MRGHYHAVPVKKCQGLSHMESVSKSIPKPTRSESARRLEQSSTNELVVYFTVGGGRGWGGVGGVSWNL